MEVTSNSPQQTKEIAKSLAKRLSKGSIVALYGDLGAGKTTFVQGLAQGLGIRGRVLSPTFVFMRTYRLKNSIDLYHIDLYRGQEAKDFKSLGLEDVFDGESIVILEWAEKIKKVLPKKRFEVEIKIKGDKKRRIKIRELK